MGYLGIFGTKDELLISDKLGKIMWFSTSTEWFNYGIVKGSKVRTNSDSEDIMILFYLFNQLADKRDIDVKWLSYPEAFVRNVKWAIKWAGEQKDNLIFKYKPSEETKEAYNQFDIARWNYKLSTSEINNDIEYNLMVEKFEKLFDLL